MLYRPSKKQLVSVDISLQNLKYINSLLQNFIIKLNENVIQSPVEKQFLFSSSSFSNNATVNLYGLSKTLFYLNEGLQFMFLNRESYKIKLVNLCGDFFRIYLKLRLLILKTSGIFFPAKKKLFTVLRSPHTDKKSREQFYFILHKFLLNYFYYSKSIQLFLRSHTFLFKNVITTKD